VCKFRGYLPEQDKETWDIVDAALGKLDVDARKRVLKLLSIKLNEDELIKDPDSTERAPVFVNVS